jgi:hypothetical protein
VRKIVIGLIVLLSISGLLVGYGGALRLPRDVTRPLSLVHDWAGLMFLVMFPLYAWDHIRLNRRWLTVPRLVTVSGALQALAGALLMLSGLVLLAYGVATWGFARSTHLWLTWFIAASVLLHYWAPKNWR